MANTVDKVIDIALGERGYLEKSKAAYQKDPSVIYRKTDGAGYDNYTKYGYEMHKIYPEVMDFPAYWCDSFVDWCFQKAYGISTAKSLLGGFDDYTIASAQAFKNKKAYFYGTNGIKPGDQVFFKNSVRIHHTGLVVDVKGNSIITVEGNTSPQGTSTQVEANGGGVWQKTYPFGYSAIDGYGRPAYEKDIKPMYPSWVKSGDDWYYRLEEGKNAHGWMVINHHWYYFNPDGKMVKGYKEIESDEYGLERYYFETAGDYEGALLVTNARGALSSFYVD
ncbi:MAG: CHAP domain-containing protein [Faecalicoccus sp.]|nr:CHAP domain-containing protein [Faecalicoccus sp.]